MNKVCRACHLNVLRLPGDHQRGHQTEQKMFITFGELRIANKMVEVKRSLKRTI